MEALLQHLFEGNDVAVQEMLAAGLDVNAQFLTNHGNYAPLLVHVAEEAHKPAADVARAVAAALALPGLDVAARDELDYTPWHAVASNADDANAMAVLRELLAARREDLNALVNEHTFDGQSALHLAVWNQSAEFVRALLTIPHIRVNDRTQADGNNSGQTPLFVAVYAQRPEIILALLDDARTDDSARGLTNALGNTPVTLAQEEDFARARDAVARAEVAEAEARAHSLAMNAAAAASAQQLAQELRRHAMVLSTPDFLHAENAERARLYRYALDHKERRALYAGAGAGGRARQQRRKKRRGKRRPRLHSKRPNPTRPHSKRRKRHVNRRA